MADFSPQICWKQIHDPESSTNPSGWGEWGFESLASFPEAFSSQAVIQILRSLIQEPKFLPIWYTSSQVWYNESSLHHKSKNGIYWEINYVSDIVLEITSYILLLIIASLG